MNIATLVKELTSTNDLENRKNASIVIKHIYGSYGKIANKETFRNAIKDCDEHTHLLLNLLIESKLFSYQSIKQLCEGLSAAYNKKNAITFITTPQKFESIVSNKRKNSTVNNTEVTGISVHDDQKIYKRTLDTDLNKLLS